MRALIMSAFLAVACCLPLGAAAQSQSPPDVLRADALRTDFALPPGATLWSDLHYLGVGRPDQNGYTIIRYCVSSVGCENAEGVVTQEAKGSQYDPDVWDGTVITDDTSQFHTDAAFPVGSTFTIRVDGPIRIFNNSAIGDDWLCPDNTPLPPDFQARAFARCP